MAIIHIKQYKYYNINPELFSDVLGYLYTKQCDELSTVIKNQEYIRSPISVRPCCLYTNMKNIMHKKHSRGKSKKNFHLLNFLEDMVNDGYITCLPLVKSKGSHPIWYEAHYPFGAISYNTENQFYITAKGMIFVNKMLNFPLPLRKRYFNKIYHYAINETNAEIEKKWIVEYDCNNFPIYRHDRKVIMSRNQFLFGALLSIVLASLALL